jgi:site-specific recombinase XerD
MNGRLEKEILAQKKMKEKLSSLPEIFNNYYLYLRAAKKTYSTINVYMNGIIRFAKFLEGNNITDKFYENVKPETIEGFLISLETTTKSGQVTRMGTDAQCTYWSYLNTFFEFLMKRNYVNENVVSKTSRPKNTDEHQTTYLDKKEIKKLMKAINNNPDNTTRLRDATIVELGIKTGLRCSALMNINISDINFDEDYIHVVEKGSKTRKIGIGVNTKEMLKKWISVREQRFSNANTDALFVSHKNNRLSADAANDMLKKYAKAAGIQKKITMHKLRSSAATNLAAAGVSIQAISHMLGHSNPSITMRYVEVLNNEQKEATNILDSLF